MHCVDFDWFRIISKVGFEQVNTGWVISAIFVKENKKQYIQIPLEIWRDFAK